MDLELFKDKFAAFVNIPKENVDVALLDYNDDEYLLRIVVREYKHRVGEDVRFPANWKEALKERYAPDWYIKMRPVLYQVVERLVAFPEINVSTFGRAEFEIRSHYERQGE